ncbi:MAG: hypothetical protein ACI9S8_001090 [Chlamydiales bacterium]|jgi:hypothetical protein
MFYATTPPICHSFHDIYRPYSTIHHSGSEVSGYLCNDKLIDEYHENKIENKKNKK